MSNNRREAEIDYITKLHENGQMSDSEYKRRTKEIKKYYKSHEGDDESRTVIPAPPPEPIEEPDESDYYPTVENNNYVPDFATFYLDGNNVEFSFDWKNYTVFHVYDKKLPPYCAEGVFELSGVRNIEIIRITQNNTRTTGNHALGGALLFGLAGAVVGASMKKTETYESLNAIIIRIHFFDYFHPYIDVYAYRNDSFRAKSIRDAEMAAQGIYNLFMDYLNMRNSGNQYMNLP